jgi:hypothetical protein
MDKNQPAGKPISRNDLEDRLRTLKADVDTVKDSTIGAGIAAAVGIGLLVVIVAFLLGRSRGKAALSFIEVRRG